MEEVAVLVKSSLRNPVGSKGPPVHIIKLTETQQIAPYRWVHPRSGEAVIPTIVSDLRLLAGWIA
jgi:hypothetical protein